MKKSETRNVEIVLNAFDTLFNKRDYATAERFWSPNYIQHSAHIPPSRDGLFNLIKTMPDTLYYENRVAAASGDFVILHGRFNGLGQRVAWVVGDIVRMEDEILAGRDSGRGDPGAVAKRSPDVRRKVSRLRCGSVPARPMETFHP